MYYSYRGKRAKNKVEFTEVSFLSSSKNLDDLIRVINDDEYMKGLPKIDIDDFENGVYEVTNKDGRDIIYRIINDKENLENQFITFSYIYSKLNTYEGIFPILKIEDERVYYIADTFFNYERDENITHRSSTYSVRSIRRNLEGLPILSDTRKSVFLIYFRFGINRHPGLYKSELDLDQLNYGELLATIDYETSILEMLISNIEPLLEYQEHVSNILIQYADKLVELKEDDEFDGNKLYLFESLLKINKILNKKIR